MFGLLSMFVISQKDLKTVSEKLEVIELAYGLNNVVLEIRRYEKNFFLYETTEALESNKHHLKDGIASVEHMEASGAKLKAQPLFRQLKQTLEKYQEAMAELSRGFYETYVIEQGELTDNIRAYGQEMVELSDKLVGFEHSQIQSILGELSRQLVIWSLVALLIGIIIPILMSFNVLRPLQIIKEATRSIAKGEFKKVSVLNTRDEMQQVLEAFNTMVGELERRQDQLVQSQKLSSIGTLSAGIAHQLNNPLNNIYTSCQIARSDFDTSDPDFIKQMLKNIDQETSRARGIVLSLLEFAREKEFTLRMENLKDIINRAVQLVRSQVPASIKVSVEVPRKLNLPMDSQRMQEVFLNLIINACQAIHGPGSIDISARISPDGKNTVISVHDSGDGVSKEIRDRLFDPFFTTKDEGMGTGLGLSITYGIIQKHNGEITVESARGEGTTFLITLPMHTEMSRE